MEYHRLGQQVYNTMVIYEFAICEDMNVILKRYRGNIFTEPKMKRGCNIEVARNAYKKLLDQGYVKC